MRAPWEPLPEPPEPRDDGMRTFADHRAYLLGCVEELPPFGQQILDAVDLAICEDVTSSVSLPGFDNSAMDGYAARVQDVASAATGPPGAAAGRRARCRPVRRLRTGSHPARR